MIISAVAKNNVIGKSNGELPWHISEEFKHFKETTLGSPIIMGRKSFDALGKPLPKRENIIISKNKELSYPFADIKIFNNLIDAFRHCKNKNYEKVFVIGGGQIYSQAIDLVDEMIISKLNFDAEGEVYFPKYDENNWEIVKRDKKEQFEIFWYKRK
ncbi:MAG: diacylglycerol kinase [Ignavibacteriales bacterium CG12_big_fil_rev_8_21_14_0_65_30_8]|nr:MAG: diacylglycerol kinase [Ignavibacteriales bacterium CG12_big_fil_rev_8_21_14_0_65_30_8]